VRYEERGQGYRDVEKVGKHCDYATEMSHRKTRRFLVIRAVVGLK
jgi:hypothetical protein